MPGAREEAWITRLAKITEEDGACIHASIVSQFHSICFRSACTLIAFLARLTEILQLMSMPSMPGIPDMPVLMAPEAVEAEGISMVIEAMWSILGGK